VHQFRCPNGSVFVGFMHRFGIFLLAASTSLAVLTRREMCVSASLTHKTPEKVPSCSPPQEYFICIAPAPIFHERMKRSRTSKSSINCTLSLVQGQNGLTCMRTHASECAVVLRLISHARTYTTYRCITPVCIQGGRYRNHLSDEKTLMWS
jgi:hypothetical protein